MLPEERPTLRSQMLGRWPSKELRKGAAFGSRRRRRRRASDHLPSVPREIFYALFFVFVE